MASIGSVNLTINIEGANARVRVRYTLYFDDFDRRSNLPYTENCYIYGDDTNVGDTLAGGDDSIPRGTIAITTVTANGSSSISRDYTKLYSRHELDEDSWPNNPDDIRARVILTPQLPVARKKDSNLVQYSF